MDYLLNSADVSFVGDLRFQDGTPVFNERELSHFVDVKRILRNVMWVWYISLAGLLVLGIWAWRGKWSAEYRRGLSRGGWLTVILMALILAFVLLGFGVFFVGFHEVFFPPGTWMFYYSDTFIRLFPEVFWQDIFIYLGLFSLIAGLALGLGFRPRKLK